jgi:epoxyqueuosine reductase
MNASAENVKVIAQRIGFDACRIARLTSPAPHAENFHAWIAAGEYGDMTWMAERPARRADPRLVMPEAASIIVVAMNYLVPSDARVAGSGRIARYAWGDDYHAIMEEKLRDLALALESMGGTHRLYVDTGPVLERSWATAAGLGWNGKSTVQIHPTLGTWFFLGEILTSLDLAPDAPAKDRCGTCTRCIVACPTQAITAPHHLDARRCLSYLTIEHRGSIPMEFRRALGDRIYGCDECLDVCPWNRFAQASQESALAARPYVGQWRLRDFLKLDDAAFRTLFRWSPIKRIKRSAFLRNVCVALGNVGTRDDLPSLAAAVETEDALIAEHARWAIGEIMARTEHCD